MKSITCPTCDGPMTLDLARWPQFPFCSPRCRLIDLGRWLGEKYRIASASSGEDVAEIEDDPELP